MDMSRVDGAKRIHQNYVKLCMNFLKNVKTDSFLLTYLAIDVAIFGLIG